MLGLMYSHMDRHQTFQRITPQRKLLYELKIYLEAFFLCLQSTHVNVDICTCNVCSLFCRYWRMLRLLRSQLQVHIPSKFSNFDSELFIHLKFSLYMKLLAQLDANKIKLCHEAKWLVTSMLTFPGNMPTCGRFPVVGGDSLFSSGDQIEHYLSFCF